MEHEKPPLRPNENTHKILISTTSRIQEEYKSDIILIAHAWQNSKNSNSAIQVKENPVSRSSFIIAFRTKSSEKSFIIPDYTHVGERICSYLCVLYGKRFDSHGLVEGSGYYYTPDFTAYNGICNPKLPFNSHEARDCFSIPLDLRHFLVLEKIFTGSLDSKFLSILDAASKFYLQAIQNAESEPEVAYLHLITAGEILSEHFEYTKEEILDEEMKIILKQIEDGIKNGSKLSKQISNRLFSVKRRFVKSLYSLIDKGFFVSTMPEKDAIFKEDDLEQRIGAAYDLRSKYVHTGVPFGKWVKPNGLLNDIQDGKPVESDAEFAKVLAKAPTFIGLERLIRYCLLKLMVDNGFEDIEKIRKIA